MSAPATVVEGFAQRQKNTILRWYPWGYIRNDLALLLRKTWVEWLIFKPCFAESKYLVAFTLSPTLVLRPKILLLFLLENGLWNIF